MQKVWNDSGMIQHMYMRYKGIDSEEKLKGHMAKLSLLTNSLSSNLKLCSAIRFHNFEYDIINIPLYKVLIDNQVMYHFSSYFNDYYIDESTAILLVSDFHFII